MKFSAIFLIAIALFATFAVARPSPLDRRSDKEIHVTSPGPGPWVIGSTQNCSWWSLNIEKDAKVVVEIRCNDKVVLTKEGECGTGNINFEIGEDWDVDGKYIAVVYLKDNEDCKGESGEFSIKKAGDDYGYGY